MKGDQMNATPFKFISKEQNTSITPFKFTSNGLGQFGACHFDCWANRTHADARGGTPRKTPRRADSK
jgi:hypothetical protein